MSTLTQQQQQSLDGNHEVQEEQDHVNGAAVSAQSHAVDRFRGEAGCFARETAVVAPSNDSVGDSSTLCSDDDDIDDDDEEEETNTENNGGWVTNPSVSSTIVQKHQGFDNTNGYVVLPNSEPSNFGDISVANSTEVRVGNDIIYNGPVTIHVNHVVYTNPTPNPKDESRLDVTRALDNISDLSEISESEVNGAPNGSIFSKNTKLNKVTQWLWRCVLALILLAIVVSVTVYFTHFSDASVFLEMTNSSLEGTNVTVPLIPSVERSEWGAPPLWNSVNKMKPPTLNDSVNNSDETQPQYTKINTQTERLVRRCKKDEFTCNNGQCISDINVCDGTRNCVDGSDEMFTLCRSLPCPPTAFRCTYIEACIDGDLRCNGVVDCADSSDEDCSNGWRPSATIETIQSPPTPTPKRPSVTPGTNTCRVPPQPLNGRWKLHRSQCSSGQDCNVPEGTELGLGSHLVYSCDSGYKIRGATDVSCSFKGKWLNIPVCTAILCQALATASTRAECIYNDEWISCKSLVPPKTRATLTCENRYRPETNLLSGQRRNVRCNANGQWEPEPMRCVPVCGTLHINGFRPNIAEFPWHASMYRDEPGKPKKYFCGASIIQENLLITAAHCVYDDNIMNIKPLIDASKIYIVTGNLFRDYNSPFHDSNLVKTNQVKRIYIQRNYLGSIGSYFSDIAILELVTPFVFSSYLVPACIDTLSDRSVLEPGSYGKVAGFGRTALGESSAVLQALIVPIISLSQCRSESQNVNTKKFITNDKFCAGYTNGSSVCDGYNGSGLVLKNNNLWFLRGVASVSLGTIQGGGTPYCNYNLFSLYTEISRHIFWIQVVIRTIEKKKTLILCSELSLTRCS